MDYEKVAELYGNVSVLDTPTFFYGMRLGEEIDVEIEQGKTLMVKLVSIGEPQRMEIVSFTWNLTVNHVKLS